MKKNSKIVLFILFITIFTANLKAQNMKYYKQQWDKVDSAQAKGLPKSALEIVNEIYEKAGKEGNTEQQIKSYIHILKFKNSIEENAFEKLTYQLDSTIKVTKSPENAVMHSMLADMYLWYYQNNRWKFYNRTNTIGFDNQDMETWTLDKLTEKVIFHYNESVKEADKLQQVPIDKFPELISKGLKTDNLRPTLYDFLANKALDFFMGSEISLTKPADNYKIKGENYFNDISEYVKIDISTTDSLSLHFHAARLMQELLKFRLSKSNEIPALIDADLKRLQFVYSYSVENDKDNLYLKRLLELETKYKQISYSAEISYKIASYYNSKSSLYNYSDIETEKYKDYKLKAHQICVAIREKYPTEYASELCKQLQISIETRNISLFCEKTVIPNKAFSAKLDYTNIKKAYIRIASISEDKYKKLINKEYGQELYKKLLSSSDAVTEFSNDLPDNKDFNPHSVEFLNKDLPLGFYLIFVADNDKFTYENAITTYTPLKVSNISFIKQTTPEGGHRFIVMNRETGNPMTGVSCNPWYEKYSYIKSQYVKSYGSSGKTGEDGVFIIKPKGEEYESWYVDFSLDKDELSTESSSYSYKRTGEPTSVNKITIFTDRAIYRPGQTIYYKGIVLTVKGDESKIVPNYSTSVVLYDVNWQNVTETTVKTNEYGTFSGTFDIPQGLMNGTFQIYTTEGAKTVQVEEYKRPKFEVEILPFKGNYILNDNVKIEGKAVSYSGASLTDASVKYRITRSPKWSGWWYRSISSTSVEIANGKVNTDDYGKFTIDFKAIPDLSFKESEYLSFNYAIQIDVTDINGETQSTSKSITVGYRALKVSLTLDDLIDKSGEDLRDKKASRIPVNTLNLNGEEIEASGDINIYKLEADNQALRSRLWSVPDKHLYSKEEWKTNFPGNVFDNESDMRYMPKGKQVFLVKFDTKDDKKLDISFMKSLDPGYYVVEMNSTDAFGNKVSNKQFFKIFNSKETKMPFAVNDLFAEINDYCEPGEKASFLIGTSFENQKIIYQIEQKGKIIKEQTLLLNNEQKLIEIPIDESYRGNISVHFSYIRNNRHYNHSSVVTVPYSNKELDIEFETFRDKLYPGQKEEWKIIIKGAKGEKVAAEMLATLYDASLDQFKKNYWNFDIYRSYYTERAWSTTTFTTSSSQVLKSGIDIPYYPSSRYYPMFNWFGFSYYSYDLRGMYNEGRADGVVVAYNISDRDIKRKKGVKAEMAKEDAEMEEDMDEFATEAPIMEKSIIADSPFLKTAPGELGGENAGKTEEVKVRTNFNETAFFYPHLETNKKGEVIVAFTIPESLTKWKMMGFATTKNLEFGFINNELITQKDLMLLPNEPRFFRENDLITFPVKISNVSDKDLTGKVNLELLDALSMQPLTNVLAKNEIASKDFTVQAGKSILVSWDLNIPEGVGAITYKVIAKAGDFSDGEQKPIPVLSNRMLVTESLPLPVRGQETVNFKFDKLLKSADSKSIVNHKLTLEFTSNPAWYAVQALPYLIEYPYECTEQTFSRFYANSLASHIANSDPKIQRIFESWKNTANSEALLSNLEKNQDLKSVLLQETPWVLDGKSESERKQRVGLLFDLNRMSTEMEAAITKVQKAQTINGGWPWFKGMPESRYITQYVVTGLGHLDVLGVKAVREDSRTWSMIKSAVGYLDRQIDKDYDWIKKNYTKEEMAQNHLSEIAIQYLYGRSYFKDVEIPGRTKEAFDYYLGQAKKYWLTQGQYSQGMIALALNRFSTPETPKEIVASLKEKSISHKEMGMYWKDNVSGYYWYQAPIETQALMVEMFDEVTDDKAAVNDLKIWLLKQKQTQDWKTTKATAEAVYALLRRGSNWLTSDELCEIKMDNKIIDPKKIDGVQVEAGTGYFKTSWSGGDIKAQMGNITITKKDEGISWGALYWQYFEDLDKITPSETPLKLKKELFIERITDKGKVIEPLKNKGELNVGDKVIVRIELRVDRRMEYIHMKDMRASGFEPENVISRYKYQDGLGYYESTKDASTNFFMDALPKGTYVFEYPLKVTHKGDFANGITTIQCMYAPEFTSHSEGIRVLVK